MRVSTSIPWYRNRRNVRWLVQLCFALGVVALVGWLLGNMHAGLARQNLGVRFDFLGETAGFSISEGPEFSAGESYWRALQVGLINTLRVASWGIFLSTILGVVIGIARLARNSLVRRTATAYVEVIRNIPLLVQLFAWYKVVFLHFPSVRQSLAFGETFFLNNRGLFYPTVEWGSADAWFTITKPVLEGFSFQGGAMLSVEYLALLTGLVIYTAAYIAEIVRGAIQSVHRGQGEAARALGLRPMQSMRYVIFPQALRVLFPPMANQYLNLAKNSSLAIAIGFADVFQVSQTIANQSGHAVPIIMLIMGIYLAMSLSISGIINWFNARMRIIR